MKLRFNVAVALLCFAYLALEWNNGRAQMADFRVYYDAADALVHGIKARGHRSAATVADADDLARKLAEVVQAHDMVVCLGAGDITKWAAGLADAIQAARG